MAGDAKIKRDFVEACDWLYLCHVRFVPDYVMCIERNREITNK